MVLWTQKNHYRVTEMTDKLFFGLCLGWMALLTGSPGWAFLIFIITLMET